MADKYGLVDANTHFFECTLDGEDVGFRCTRGNDIDGWVDLLPVDDEGEIISVCSKRHRGEIVFTDVRPTHTGRYLVAHLVEDMHDLKVRLAQMERDFGALRESNATQMDMDFLRHDMQTLRADLAAEPATDKADNEVIIPVHTVPVKNMRIVP